MDSVVLVLTLWESYFRFIGVIILSEFIEGEVIEVHLVCSVCAALHKICFKYK